MPSPSEVTIDTLSLPVRERRSRHSGLLEHLFRLASLARQRKALGELPDHLLKDIGIPRDAALRESRRPIWDAPGHWKRR